MALFRVATSCPASRRILAYRSLARARAAGNTSSGSSTTQVSTYCKREFVSATCVCTRVNSDCTSLATFASVANYKMRPSKSAMASVLSLFSSSCSQAATRNACSERKPRSLTAARTWSRRSAEGYRKLRGKLFSLINCLLFSWYHGGCPYRECCPARMPLKSATTSSMRVNARQNATMLQVLRLAK